MSSPLHGEITVLRGCLKDLLGWVDDTLSATVPAEPTTEWERPDIYAGATLGDAGELAAGILAELDVEHVQNASRLARHLYETEIELRWVLADPTHLRRRWAEQARSSFERLPKDQATAIVAALGHADRINDFLNLLAEERKRLGRGADAGVMPGFKTIAEELGIADEHETRYALMSWGSHPDLSSAGRHVVAVEDRVGFTRRPSPIEPFFITVPLCQACRSLGAILRDAREALGLPASRDISDAATLADATCQHLEEVYGRSVGSEPFETD